MSKERKTRKKYKRGDVLGLLINANVSDELLEWFNTRDYYGPAIIDVLERYVNNLLISPECLKAFFDIEITPKHTLPKEQRTPMTDNHNNHNRQVSSANDKETPEANKKEVLETDSEQPSGKIVNNKKKRIMPDFSFNVKSIVDENE